MKKIFKGIKSSFEEYPLLFSLFLSAVITFVCSFIIALSSRDQSEGLPAIIIPAFWLFCLPIFLTTFNVLLLLFSYNATNRKDIFAGELLGIGAGGFLTLLFLTAMDVSFADYNTQLYGFGLHSPIAGEHFLTFLIITLLSFLGFLILRLVPILKLPPLLAVLSISSLYLGMGICIIWCFQMWQFYLDENLQTYIITLLFPLNIVIIYIRTIKDIILAKLKAEKEDPTYISLPKNKVLALLSGLLKRAANWYWLGFIFALPLLGIILLILLIFGQEPDSIIKMWTETADWSLSEKIAPPNLPADGHYLCTVAAGGHKRLVRPLRTGIRHGEKIIVNRQLMVANAFEDLMHEKTPRFHKAVRGFYDKYGLPVARLIKTPLAADVVYVIMKPLEWLFLAVLYLFDAKPENRIAIQYPHNAPPKG